MSGRIRVICERIMSRGYEPAVASLMEAAQAGLLSVTAYNQLNQSNKYVVFFEDYDTWLRSKEFKECTAKIEEVLDIFGKGTTIFKHPNEAIFLL